jgi:hypothetical protein
MWGRMGGAEGACYTADVPQRVREEPWAQRGRAVRRDEERSAAAGRVRRGAARV